MIRRDKEVDVAVGDIRIVILIHLDGKEFLWPVLRQRSSDSNVTGLLGKRIERTLTFSCFNEMDTEFTCPVTLLVFSALQTVVYEELQQLPKKLKIGDQEIGATRYVCQTLPFKC